MSPRIYGAVDCRRYSCEKVDGRIHCTDTQGTLPSRIFVEVNEEPTPVTMEGDDMDMVHVEDNVPPDATDREPEEPLIPFDDRYQGNSWPGTNFSSPKRVHVGGTSLFIYPLTHDHGYDDRGGVYHYQKKLWAVYDHEPSASEKAHNNVTANTCGQFQQDETYPHLLEIDGIKLGGKKICPALKSGKVAETIVQLAIHVMNKEMYSGLVLKDEVESSEHKYVSMRSILCGQPAYYEKFGFRYMLSGWDEYVELTTPVAHMTRDEAFSIPIFRVRDQFKEIMHAHYGIKVLELKAFRSRTKGYLTTIDIPREE